MPAGSGALPDLAAAGIGLEPGTHYQQTHLSMAEYESLYAEWVAGGVSLDEIESRHGRSTRELLEVQRVAIEHGLDTCEG